MPENITVALVDDHALFRHGVRQILCEHQDIDVVAEGGTAKEAIAIAQSVMPDVMVLDIMMPGGGIAAAGTISKTRPAVKILFLTVSENENDISAAMRSGGRGYILKGVSGLELVQTVRSISKGELYVSPSLAVRALSNPKRNGRSVPDRPIGGRLTAREEQVLEHVAEGLTNLEIAGKLYIREKTAKFYMTTIMQKLHVRNRVEAVLKLQGKL